MTRDDEWSHSGFTWFPDATAQQPPWSHTSGWMLLSGERRRLSCVIPIREQPSILSRLLPAVSDALTESGYPWEIVVVDAGGDGQAMGVARRFAEITSLRVAVSDEPVSRAQALLAGMAGARGDALLLLDANREALLWQVPRMVERWTGGVAVVSARDGVPGPGGTEPDAVDEEAAIDTRDFGQARGHLILLDRRVAARLAAGV